MKRTINLFDTENPLVSIRVFNYNYGSYLRECLESAVNQTYPNIEICFSDNCSTDESWGIALEYQRRYPEIFSIARNASNKGVYGNMVNCAVFTRGRYMLQLCSDDALANNFIEKCVSAFKQHPECCMVMVNRDIMDEDSNITAEPPFYNQSCIIDGKEQAAVFMMAAVNPSVSQVMYDFRKYKSTIGNTPHSLAGRWYAMRIADFTMTCNFPMGYIKEPLLKHRLHGMNDSLGAAKDLIEVVGPYVLHRQFTEIARPAKASKAIERLPEATEKLSQLCLRYSIRGIIDGELDIATRYLHLSVALWVGIQDNPEYKELDRYFRSGDKEKEEICMKLKEKINFETRNVSYDPPPGSIPLEI